MCVLSVCVRERVCCNGGEGSFGCVCVLGGVYGGGYEECEVFGRLNGELH